MKNDKKASKELLLSTENPSKMIIKLAIPATLALLAKAVYNLVDSAYIGLLDDSNALAAVGVTLPLLLIMVSIENIFAAGASVLAGRQLGAGDKTKANQTITTIIAFSMFVGVGLCIAGIIFMDPVLRAFGVGAPFSHRHETTPSGCSSRHCSICRHKA